MAQNGQSCYLCQEGWCAQWMQDWFLDKFTLGTQIWYYISWFCKKHSYGKALLSSSNHKHVQICTINKCVICKKRAEWAISFLLISKIVNGGNATKMKNPQ